jgi:hypothetical protein
VPLTAYLDNCKLSSVQSGITTEAALADELSGAKCRSASALVFSVHLLLASGVFCAIYKQEDLTSW